jgi:transcriptional regulator with XRE-family HTH domain
LPTCQITLKADRPKPYPKELNTLGDHLKKKRLDLGLLRKEAAQIIGVNPTTIRNWEINRFAPKIRYIPRIIDFLGHYPYRPSQSFPDWLRRCRTVAGFSQEKLAGLLRVDESTVVGWEQGRHRPTKRNQLKIQKFFCSWEPAGQPFRWSVLRLSTSF